MKPQYNYLFNQVIKKWTSITFYRGKDLGNRNCAFCMFFFYESREDTKNIPCHNCPIHKITNMPFCAGTPYNDFIDCLDSENIGRHNNKVHNYESYLQALKMLRFIISIHVCEDFKKTQNKKVDRLEEIFNNLSPKEQGKFYDHGLNQQQVTNIIE